MMCVELNLLFCVPINFYAFKGCNVITFYCAIDASPFCSFEKLCAWKVVRWYRMRVIDKNRYTLGGRFLELSNYWVVLVITKGIIFKQISSNSVMLT